MTPYERILRNKGMQAYAFEQEKPVTAEAPFPRNAIGLAVLCFALVPLVYKAIVDPSAQNILGYGALVSLFGLGLWCLAKGQKYHATYTRSSVAHAAVIPFKLIGAGVFGLSAATLTWFQDGTAVQALSVLVVMAALCVVAFGRDPLVDKGLDTAKQRHDHKLDALSAQVGKQMERVREAANIHADKDVMPRMRAFDAAVDDLLSAAMRDPERISSLRKFFGVYLDGAAEAAERFASVYSGTGDLAAKQKYLALLEKLTHAFDAKAHEYAAAGKMKLDVQIDVLDQSLSNEALRSA